MARRVFFSFHYDRDVQRAHVVRKSWVTKADRQDAGFFDWSVFESKKRTSDETLRRFLDKGLVGSSVTCVLIGNQTAWRRWVRYELLKSFAEGKALLGIYVHSIPHFTLGTDVAGTNPFSCVGFEVQNERAFFKEWNGSQWVWSTDCPSVPVSRVGYGLQKWSNVTFDGVFQTYDWNLHRGYDNVGHWIDTAAIQAGR